MSLRLLRRRRRRAYTLVEVALAVAVGTVLMLVILELLRKSSQIFAQKNEKLDALQSATMISEIIHRDLRYMVVPLHAPPAEAAPEIAAATTPDPNDPNAATPAPSPAPAPTMAPAAPATSGENSPLRPFTDGTRVGGGEAWNQARARPDAKGGVVFDLTDGGTASPTTEFTFYRTKLTRSGGGLFGTGGDEAKYQLLRVTYKAVPSQKYTEPQLYVMQRKVDEVELDAGADRKTVRVVTEDADPRIYKMFYFRRLVLSLHEAPEAGLVGAGNGASNSASGVIPTVAGAIAAAVTGGNAAAAPEVPFDALYFARIMIAGASAGSGARVVAKAGDAPSARTQNLDLLVNLIHLDGVTDRFRGRSLARNWNSELPVNDD